MNFQNLHELLRVEIVRRIDQGTLTGTRLAREAGFRQAHISNFLNRRRSLSLEGLDRVMAAQSLTVDQLLPVELLASDARSLSRPIMEEIPLVSPTVAMGHACIAPSSIIETIHVSATRLQDHRPRPGPGNSNSDRFVGIRVDAQQAAAMDPYLTPGAIAVIDRHYNSLAPYRPQQRTLYAVRCGLALLLRFVDFDDGRFILRPAVLDHPVNLIALAADEAPSDFLVGRVCLVMSEL